jgi:hypothetical protein
MSGVAAAPRPTESGKLIQNLNPLNVGLEVNVSFRPAVDRAPQTRQGDVDDVWMSRNLAEERRSAL